MPITKQDGIQVGCSLRTQTPHYARAPPVAVRPRHYRASGWQRVIFSEVPRDTTVSLIPAPFGDGDAALGFTDAFVKRATCDAQCAAAATAFARYMTDSTTFAWMLMSDDAGPNGVPRYLTPATLSAFETPRVAADPYYDIIALAALEAAAIPSFGIPAVKDTMRQELRQLIAQLAAARQRAR